MYADPTVTPEGPRSLHFRGMRPIPRLRELASSCVRPQTAALRDYAQEEGAEQRPRPDGRDARERDRDKAKVVSP